MGDTEENSCYISDNLHFVYDQGNHNPHIWLLMFSYIQFYLSLSFLLYYNAYSASVNQIFFNVKQFGLQ